MQSALSLTGILGTCTCTCTCPSYPHLKTIQANCARAFGAAIAWVDKRYLWLGKGCLEYDLPIITNACPPKPSQKSLQPNFEPILARDSEVSRIEVYARGAGVYADLAKTTWRQDVQNDLTNDRAANWEPKVTFSPLPSLSRQGPRLTLHCLC